MTTRRLAAWIEASCWAFAALGLLLPLLFHSAPFSLLREALGAWVYGARPWPPEDGRLLGLMLGITGGSLAGKWIVHALVARGPLAEGRAWARDLTMAGLLVWLTVEAAAAWSLGATFHVALVVLPPLLVVALPLAAGWSLFEREAAPPAPTTLAARAALWTAVAGCGTGVAIAFGGTTPLWTPWFDGLRAAHYGGAELAEPARRLAMFFFGPIGACTLAQFSMLVVLVRMEGPTVRAAAAGTLSIAAWFLIDGAYGIAHDGWFNILLVNVPAVVLMLPAWIATGTSARTGR